MRYYDGDISTNNEVNVSAEPDVPQYSFTTQAKTFRLLGLSISVDSNFQNNAKWSMQLGSTHLRQGWIEWDKTSLVFQAVPVPDYIELDPSSTISISAFNYQGSIAGFFSVYIIGYYI